MMSYGYDVTLQIEQIKQFNVQKVMGQVYVDVLNVTNFLYSW